MTELVFVNESPAPPSVGPPVTAPPSVSPPSSPLMSSLNESVSPDEEQQQKKKKQKKRKDTEDGKKAKRHRKDKDSEKDKKEEKDKKKKKKKKKKSSSSNSVKFSDSTSVARFEKGSKPSDVVIHIEDDSEMQEAILASVSRPPSVPAPEQRVEEEQRAESRAVFELSERGVIPPAPDNFIPAQEEPAPAPVVVESQAEYHISMMKFKQDRIHHQYFHATVTAAEVIQFFRAGSVRPIQYTISVNSANYCEFIRLLLAPDLDVRHLLDWLKTHYAPGGLDLNQVAVHVHGFVIPEDMPGSWAQYGL